MNGEKEKRMLFDVDAIRFAAMELCSLATTDVNREDERVRDRAECVMEECSTILSCCEMIACSIKRGDA